MAQLRIPDEQTDLIVVLCRAKTGQFSFYSILVQL